jgi:predicted O-methyltransferase YrrM
MAAASFEEARRVVADTGGGTDPGRAAEIHDFVRRERPRECLELGFAHGAGTVYIASALEANGAGRLTSVDRAVARELEPSAEQLVGRAGLEHRVELVHEQSSYNWFLHRRIRERTRDGECEPYLDFCFLDGAHTWVDDGLAFFLVDKLLRPGGWILFDDLNWRMPEEWDMVPEQERRMTQVQEVFELLVQQHPAYDLIETDGRWGWARKSPDAQAAVRTVVRRDQLAALRQGARILRSRIRRGAL